MLVTQKSFLYVMPFWLSSAHAFASHMFHPKPILLFVILDFIFIPSCWSKGKAITKNRSPQCLFYQNVKKSTIYVRTFYTALKSKRITLNKMKESHSLMLWYTIDKYHHHHQHYNVTNLFTRKFTHIYIHIGTTF